jgi:hypothetical protein
VLACMQPKRRELGCKWEDAVARDQHWHGVCLCMQWSTSHSVCTTCTSTSITSACSGVNKTKPCRSTVPQVMGQVGAPCGLNAHTDKLRDKRYKHCREQYLTT